MPEPKSKEVLDAGSANSDRGLSEKILSASFTLLGISIGFYGIIYVAIDEAGPWRDERAEILPFLVLTAAIVVFNCLLAILAILDLSGYVRARSVMIWATCLMLLLISLFVVARSLLLFI